MSPAVAGALASLVERALGPSGRTRAEYLTLRAVASDGPFASLAELADHLVADRRAALDLPSVRRVVERLRIEGMLTSGPVRLTRYGADVLDGMTTAVDRAWTLAAFAE
jgi:hypothetical protein